MSVRADGIADDMTLWPDVRYPDIYAYLIESRGIHTREATKAYNRCRQTTARGPHAACQRNSCGLSNSKFERESYQATPNNIVSILFSSRRCAYAWESADQKAFFSLKAFYFLF